jgi:hypothetical protein
MSGAIGTLAIGIGGIGVSGSTAASPVVAIGPASGQHIQNAFINVQAQLNDLPDTFRRQDAPYTQLIDAFSGGLTSFVAGTDGVTAQVATFQAAQGGWLDLWGLLFLVPRNRNEGDAPYSVRIAETVLAQVATLPALQAWVALFAPGGTVVENPSGLGYTLTLPPTLALSGVIDFLQNLGRIRPAGVPFVLQQASGGLYLGTEAFLALGRVQGSYLAEPTSAQALAIAATTNNARVLIPTTFLTDPSVNGLV